MDRTRGFDRVLAGCEGYGVVSPKGEKEESFSYDNDDYDHA